MKFAGFPRDVRYTPAPAPLFGPLLESIDDLVELKCTLRAIGLLHQARGRPRWLSEGDLLEDRTLLAALRRQDMPPREAVRSGMHQAVERGTFLCLALSADGPQERVYLLNDDAGRRATEALVGQGLAAPVTPPLTRDPGKDGPDQRPNIFILYEENIGMVTPLLSEEMKEAEQSYPARWIEEAFKVAVGRNRRSWRYIEATLRRWATEGKDDGEYRRHTEEDLGKEDLLAYLRRRGRLPQP